MKCRDCGADIVFVRMTSGKAMPCNSDKVWYRPADGGTQNIIAEAGITTRAELVEPGTPGAYQGYVPHWASCPGANRFRRKRK